MAALRGLELRCFGPPTALLGGRPAPAAVVWPKHLAFLIYLALSPGRRRSRETLMGVFWGDSAQDHARGALNQALSQLRKHLGKDRILNDGLTTLVLNDRDLDVDALRVTAMVDRAPADAVELLRSEFLEGMNVRDAPGFEDWAGPERRQYAQLRVRALVTAAARRLSESQLAAAAALAAEALEAEPHAESAVTVQIQALALAGDTAAALAAFHAFAERLQRDLGESPSKTLSAIADSIRRESLRRGTRPHTPADTPLVGRAHVHREVSETLGSGLSGGSRTILITGEPGMGRSRLLADCIARAMLKGGRVFRARQLESDHDTRWSLLAQVFREGLAGAPGLTGARPDALTVLGSLVPELAQRFTPRPAGDVAEVASAVAAVLGAIADEAPVLLAVDDAQWADGPSIAALHAALRSLPAARVVLAATAAIGTGAPPRELGQLEADLGSGLPGVTLALPRLEHDDLRALVATQAKWCHDEIECDRLTRRLMLETAGNAFFAVTLLMGLERAARLRDDLLTWPLPNQSDIDPLPISVPSMVRQAVVLRIGELDKSEQGILRAAAIAHDRIDVPLITQLTQQSAAEVERALAGLERRHLVKYDGSRYAFAAPLIALVVREADLTRGERRQLEERAVTALASRADLDARVLRCELLSRVQPDAAALDFVLATIQEAAGSGAARAARRAWASGERIVAHGKVDRTALERARPTVFPAG